MTAAEQCARNGRILARRLDEIEKRLDDLVESINDDHRHIWSLQDTVDAHFEEIIRLLKKTGLVPLP